MTVSLTPQTMHTLCPQSGPSHEDIIPVPEKTSPDKSNSQKKQPSPETRQNTAETYGTKSWPLLSSRGKH